MNGNMNGHSWRTTAYAWIVGLTVWTSACYAMIAVG